MELTFTNNIKSKGFTLIELIGVMAIIAILAAAIAPSIIRDIDRAVGDVEQSQLATLASELKLYIRSAKIIPSASTWDNALASVSSIPVARITQNDRLTNRAFYVDPQFFSPSNAVFSQYTQTNGLTVKPNSPRIIIASNLKGTLPATLSSLSDFNAVWNQVAGAAIIESADIKIQRINLQGLFHRVLFTNNNTALSPGYRLETGVTQSISSTSLERYILEDTKINIYDAPFTSNVLSQVLLLDEAKSFTYDNSAGVWEWNVL